MSTQIKDLLQQGALSITLKVTPAHTVVIARMPDETYKANGPSVDVALDRCLEKTEKHAKNVKRLRRQKERERQNILESMEVDEYGDEAEDSSGFRETVDYD